MSTKQWSSLILELNLIRKSWDRYAKIELHTPGLKKIISYGTRTNDFRED